MKAQDAVSAIEKTKRLLRVLEKRNGHRLAKVLERNPDSGYMEGVNATCRALNCDLDDLDVNDLIEALNDQEPV